MHTISSRATNARLLFILVLIAASLGLAGPAMADTASGVVTQTSGPLVVTQGPTVSQYGVLAPVKASATGTIRTSGGALVEACAIYLKVWRNHSLIANSSENCVPGARTVSVAKSWSEIWASGTWITAQSWFDVRYRVPGQASVTHRFASPRAAIPVY